MKNQVCMAMACLFLAACGGGSETKQAGLEVISVETALDNPVELKASDCFKKIRYVALETADSCLIGNNPYVFLLNEYIVVTSGKKYCMLFNKETGRFVRSIGHVGNDPEGYASAEGVWENPNTNELYFPKGNGMNIVYGTDGKMVSTWKALIADGSFPNFSYYAHLDASHIAGFYLPSDSCPARLALFRGDEIVRVDTLPVGDKEEKGFDVSSIASISVYNDGNNGYIILQSKGNRFAAYQLGPVCYWRSGEQLSFKQPYNDTIYSISARELLEPLYKLDFGKYSWAYEERFEDKKDAAYPMKFMENENVILFRFVTNIFNEKKKIYNALYNKVDGTVKVCPFDDKITDDMNGFLPLHPLSVSASGEFAAVLPAEEVVAWFEENAGKTDIPAEVAALKQVGEEDNPVVAIME